MSKVIEINAQQFQQEVLESKSPVLVDFWAPWCGPCRMVAPIVDELADDYAGRLKVVKINVDENTELAAQYRVTSIPAFLVFKDGKQLEAFTGFIPKAELAEKLDNLQARERK